VRDSAVVAQDAHGLLEARDTRFAVVLRQRMPRPPVERQRRNQENQEKQNREGEEEFASARH